MIFVLVCDGRSTHRTTFAIRVVLRLPYVLYDVRRTVTNITEKYCDCIVKSLPNNKEVRKESL